jgi:predicted DNA-binding transcriptional regulator AlpA
MWSAVIWSGRSAFSDIGDSYVGLDASRICPTWAYTEYLRSDSNLCQHNLAVNFPVELEIRDEGGLPMQQELITAEEFAREWLGIKPESLYARRSRNPQLLPPVVKIGRRIYFRRSTVIEWLDEQERRQRRPRKMPRAPSERGR